VVADRRSINKRQSCLLFLITRIPNIKDRRGSTLVASILAPAAKDCVCLYVVGVARAEGSGGRVRRTNDSKSSNNSTTKSGIASEILPTFMQGAGIGGKGCTTMSLNTLSPALNVKNEAGFALRNFSILNVDPDCMGKDWGGCCNDAAK